MSQWGENDRFKVQQRSQMATDAQRTRQAAERANEGRRHLWILTYISLGIAVLSLGVAIIALMK